MIKEFKRDISSLNDIFEYVSAFIDQHKIDDDTAYTLNLAVEEVFTNLVKYDPDAAEAIPVDLNLDGKEIRIELTNHGGHEFNLVEQPPVDTNIPLRDRRIGGLGLHLVRHMVDDISYQYVGGTSIIRIVKFLEDSRV
jgi:anti-sigma regulatory factor (Ser/Thr protein kinase)